MSSVRALAVDDEFDATQGVCANTAYQRYPIMTYAGRVSHLDGINRTGRIQPVGGVICSNMEFSLDSDPLGIPCQVELSLGDWITFSLGKATGSWNEPVYAFHIIKATTLNAALKVQQQSLDIARPLWEQVAQKELEAKEETGYSTKPLWEQVVQQELEAKVQQQSLDIAKPLWEQVVQQELDAKEETACMYQLIRSHYKCALERRNRELQKLGDRGAL